MWGSPHTTTDENRGDRYLDSRLRGNDGDSPRVASPPPRFAALARPLPQTGGGEAPVIDDSV